MKIDDGKCLLVQFNNLPKWGYSFSTSHDFMNTVAFNGTRSFAVLMLKSSHGTVHTKTMAEHPEKMVQFYHSICYYQFLFQRTNSMLVKQYNLTIQNCGVGIVLDGRWRMDRRTQGYLDEQTNRQTDKYTNSRTNMYKTTV